MLLRAGQGNCFYSSKRLLQAFQSSYLHETFSQGTFFFLFKPPCFLKSFSWGKVMWVISSEILFKVGDRGLKRPVGSESPGSFCCLGFLPRSPAAPSGWFQAENSPWSCERTRSTSRCWNPPRLRSPRWAQPKETTSVTSAESCEFNFKKQEKLLSTCLAFLLMPLLSGLHSVDPKLL